MTLGWSAFEDLRGARIFLSPSKQPYIRGITAQNTNLTFLLLDNILSVTIHFKEI